MESARSHGQMGARLLTAIDGLGGSIGMQEINRANSAIRSYGNERELWAALSSLIGQAIREVTVSSQELAAFGEARGELYYLLGQLHKRQVAVRLLCPPCTLMPARIRTQLGELSRSGLDIRVARRLGCSLVVIDGRYVALGGTEARPEEPVVCKEPALARVVRDLLVRVHSGAGPIDGFLRYHDSEKAGLMVEVLGSLCRGSKDESAARDLGLSVRTYRRRVADVLSWLEAGSRFEAGVRAAELGLIAGPPR